MIYKIADVTWNDDGTMATEEKGALLDIEPPEMTPLMSLEILKFISYGRFEFDFDSIEKPLKALEIIKNLPQEEKEMLLNAIYTYTLSEEKYDLVKEELL